jgi:mono/diheme cytochrome c family protein
MKKTLVLSVVVLSAVALVYLLNAHAKAKAASLDKPAVENPDGRNAAPVTFTKDVAPIVWDNCVKCHRPGEVAPFALMSYKDVKKHASQIADVTETHYMPPWKPEAGHGDFVGERRITEAQMKTIQAWVKQGEPEGDRALLPPLPKFATGADGAAWELGPPDMIVKMPKPFTVQAEGRDEFRSFVIPLNLPEDKYVTAVEFRPSNRKVVHHALIFLDSSGKARELDGADGQPGWSKGAGGLGFTPSGGLGGWSPGVTPRPLPDGLGRPIPKGSDIVFQMHFHPSGKPEVEQSTLGIYFNKTLPDKITISFPKPSRPINIPPGEKNYVLDDSFVVPSDVTLVGIFPHAHLLCKEVKVDATLPDGTVKPLIWIKDWDWNWQDMYLYKEPVHIPARTKVSLHYVYDNSTDNIHNPTTPPKRVTWGEQTTDEMAITFFQIEADRSMMEGLAALRGRFGARRGTTQPQ